MDLKNIFNPIDNLIVDNITDKHLDVLLRRHIDNKAIGGEQWFREYSNWFTMPAYINPYKTPYHELQLLIEKKNDISRYTYRAFKIFYGVGTGDTEILPVNWDLEAHKFSEVYAIEVIRYFIETFIQNLRNLGKEYKKSRIRFLGNHTMFENLSPSDFKFGDISNGRKINRVHICFGNTIGNFNQDQIFTIFSNNMKSDDYLILGYQLRKNIDMILEQYKDNKFFENLIIDSVKRILHFDTIFKKKLDWKINKKEDQIEAYIGDILAFRSKKYCIKKLEEFVLSYDLEPIDSHSYKDCGISIFKKVTSKNNNTR